MYLRDKEKREVDFLVTKDQAPWLTVECKLSKGQLDTSYQYFQNRLKCPYVQVVGDTQVPKVKLKDKSAAVLPATQFLTLLP